MINVKTAQENLFQNVEEYLYKKQSHAGFLDGVEKKITNAIDKLKFSIDLLCIKQSQFFTISSNLKEPLEGIDPCLIHLQEEYKDLFIFYFEYLGYLIEFGEKDIRISWRKISDNLV